MPRLEAQVRCSAWVLARHRPPACISATRRSPRGEDNSPLLGMYRAIDGALRGPDAHIADTLYTPLHGALKTLLEKYRGDL